MSIDESFTFPPSLQEALGEIALIRQVTTKAKSTVLIANCASGPVVLKRADATRLQHENLLYSTILPAVGITAPRVLGLFEDEKTLWLVTEFIDGRQPDLTKYEDLKAVSRWVARMHLAGRTMNRTIPEAPVRHDPLKRLEALENMLSTNTGEHSDELAMCRQLRKLLPELAEIESSLTITLTHGDLAQQNLVIHSDGVVGLDWERAHVGSPMIDLWMVDPNIYRAYEVELGVDPMDCTPMAAFDAGITLARLTHNIAGKNRERRHWYLRTATEAAIRALARSGEN